MMLITACRRSFATVRVAEKSSGQALRAGASECTQSHQKAVQVCSAPAAAGDKLRSVPSLIYRACAVCRTHEKELKAVAVRFEADTMQQAGGPGAGLQEPHVQAAIRVSSRQSIEASALTY